MKKLYVLVLALVSLYMNAQIINIPDPNFKYQMTHASPDAPYQLAKDAAGNYITVDVNHNGEIEMDEAASVAFIWTSGAFGNPLVPMQTLEGIQSFQNLKELWVATQNIQTLDLSGMQSLEKLKVSYGYSVSIQQLHLNNMPALKQLSITGINIPTFSFTGTTNLQTLICDHTTAAIDFSWFPNLKSLKWTYSTGLNLSNINLLTNLEDLDLSYNQLASLNIDGLTNLKTLNVLRNNLTALNVATFPGLTTFVCSQNRLTEINLSINTALINLTCLANRFTSLDVSANTNLKVFKCTNNALTHLEVGTLINLDTLACAINPIPTLDVQNLSHLKSLEIVSTNVAELNLSNCHELEILQLDNAFLTSLDLSALPNLKELSCASNPIRSIDFSAQSMLRLVNLFRTNIQTVDISNQSMLTSFNVAYNTQLTTIFAKNGTLESTFRVDGSPAIQYVCTDENQVDDLKSILSGYGLASTVVNSYCSFVPGGTFYTIRGNSHFDDDENGCDDLDLIYPNLRLGVTGNAATGGVISDHLGAYRIDIQSGTYTLEPTPENPGYFNFSPPTATIGFPSAASPFSQDFCVTRNGNHPDLEIIVIPLGAAIPGYSTDYKIIYKNKGTHAQSGAIVFRFDDAVLDFDAAVPAPTPATGSLSWNFSDLQPFETREIMLALHVHSPMDIPAVNTDDVLTFHATVNSPSTDETPGDNTFVLQQIAVNSMDPNDKTCLEGKEIAPEMAGKYVHYLIRFENTGTFLAKNIVVSDVIDTDKFDLSSLVALDGSHNFTTKISGSKLEFLFREINLPFDDASNDGYLLFKIKIKPTLTSGDSFSNKAEIYFDYNFPILTNTATTTIAALAITDFKFSDYFKLYPNPANDVLNIQLKKEVKISSVSIYNTLGQLILINTNFSRSGSIDVSALKSGNYFIKVNSDQGTSNAKFVKK
ncbi:hypothetical protein FNO01nite_32470 [Flavobacterium noncentrifugens]|uniref:Por secretion system C-terminal sorting domain-containing protein n=1 Tax=Flavobacterium noncentrifugens TaxID=1128970 RepID=A0A1G9D7H7_9FLAO|nr:T9SS type A sorting domain-containing protein [Flavobacterium noncentrifugens]GEP52575.1 hypothetical protein FNO01nite_32470 [Flavobacterium noncentrifugens]SDK59870.1 Por secretion system C-terminal sorting domain-containing protein [Flavobacterium noncentrifugens]